MKLGLHEAQTNDVTGQLEKRILNLGEPIQAPPQAAEGMQPGNGSLHEPAKNAKAAPVLRLTRGQHRLDTQLTQPLPHRFRIIGPIALQALRFLPFGSRFAADRRHVQQHA
jgi:hypothetical protein